MLSRSPADILVVEDTATQAAAAKALLEDLGHRVRLAETAGHGLAEALCWQPDAVLLDLGLPDFPGLELLRRLWEAKSTAAVIVVTAQGSVSAAVEAMRAGATDFVVKPFSKARLSSALENAVARRVAAPQPRAARATARREQFFGFVGASPAMQAAYQVMELVAPSLATVFITGESGTGKELAAEAVHKASPRRAKPFIAVNCGAIPRDLLESEIFGHVKGAFTGATENRAGAAQSADGGTLFLDEIGEMPLDMQVKLLRFVQTRMVQPVGGSRSERVDVRLVCATNRDPLAEVEAGRFREDLYYRLHVVPVSLPPLRERGDDVVLIARRFLARFAQEEGRHFRDLAQDAEEALLGYAWPGNVRQLENVLRSVVVLNDGELVTRAMLPAPLSRLASVCPPPPRVEAGPVLSTDDAPPPAAAPLPPMRTDDDAPREDAVPPAREDAVMPLWLAEKRMILAALEHTGRDVPRAAALLQVNPSTIYRKLHAWRNAPE